MMIFSFPNYNIWSSPLFLLTLQGLVFAFLLMFRWLQKRKVSDLLLAILLGILCYHRTTYIIGFMDWYDTYKNTKINYYLISLSFAVGPLLYFYVKSVTSSGFKFKKKDLVHFIPQLLYIIYKLFLLGYDSMQPGYEDVQNGYLVTNYDFKYFVPFYVLLTNVQLMLYLVFTIQLFYKYKEKIYQFYSNTYKLELNWLRNFLAIYVLLFIYEVLETVITTSIVNLHWTQKWWYHFIAALAIIYIGVKGYFTNTNTLKDLEFNHVEAKSIQPVEPEKRMLYVKEKEKIENYIHSNLSYLDQDLSLKSLAKGLEITPSYLSEIINNGFQMNFNDYINRYRVEAVKKQIVEGYHKELSLLGIAYNCGFNSKATFNRVFKKMEGVSPSAFASSVISD